nr:hypothetical protein [uncultured Pseudomonas sp.]
MSTFTAYFCGTGATAADVSNRDYWNGELISTLAFNDKSREFADKIVIDGPGSGNLQDDMLFVDDGDHGSAMGSLLGNGWEENVAHALQMIKGMSLWQRGTRTKTEYERLKALGVPLAAPGSTGNWFRDRYDYGDRGTTPQELQEQLIRQFRDPLLPTQVNLVGWSRGGISCHMLANAMADDPELMHIPVNILAVDPVPGILNVQDARTTLGANVREYVGFYARDERSKGFACVIPEVASSTRTSVFPIPGRHATLVGNASLTGVGPGAELKSPGLLVRHVAEVCLSKWGVQLDNCLGLSREQIEGHCVEVGANDERYRAMRTHSYVSASFVHLKEGDEGDRFVHHGSEHSSFSQIVGAQYDPQDGLGLNALHAGVFDAIVG